MEVRHSFSLVIALEAASEKLFLNCNAFVDADLEAFVDGFLACAYSDRSIAGNSGSHLLSCRHKIRKRINLVHKADSLSLSGINVTCGIDKLFCHSCAYKTCKSLCAAETGGDSKAHLGLSEKRVLGADADITGHGDLAAAAQSKSVDRSNYGNRELLDLKENIISLLTESSALCLGHGAHSTDVCACNERLLACAGKDQAANNAEIYGVKSLLQLVKNIFVESVECLRTVDGNNTNGFFSVLPSNLIFIIMAAAYGAAAVLPIYQMLLNYI